MKVSFFGLIAVLGCVATANTAFGGNVYSNIDMRNANGDTIRINRGYSVDGGDRSYSRRTGSAMAYTPAAREYEYTETAPKRARSTSASSVKRKYFIANPFYQPLEGNFGSVTTLGFSNGSYKFAGVDRDLDQWTVKEDISYGLTDKVAVLGVAQYDDTKLKWKNAAGTDTNKSDGLNIYGLGIQGRIVDTNEWISVVSAGYEHQQHGVDYFLADIKAGYKVAMSTIYGFGGLRIIDMEGDVYGDYMRDGTDWAMLVYSDNKDLIFMGELGAGVWSVLAEDWTLNVEGVYGMYDWHNQFSVKGAIGWQPNDWFALNLYAKTSLYDSANDKKLEFHYGTVPFNSADWMNNAVLVEMNKYREWSAGLQVVFQF